NPLSTEKRYWISQRIWNQFSETNKAGIIFHEFSYRYLRPEDSRVIRELTAFVFSTDFQSLTKDEVNQALRMLGL
ncbi:MAG: hypothetical protein K2Q18_15000, partial [Bdellovibrionales bacterium]|nr:hypothetical protein [Bdellovibrionales bacterium]